MTSLTRRAFLAASALSVIATGLAQAGHRPNHKPRPVPTPSPTPQPPAILTPMASLPFVLGVRHAT